VALTADPPEEDDPGYRSAGLDLFLAEGQ